MRERVLVLLNDVNEEICNYQGKQLFEDGIIDSFDIMQIVASLEEEFEIELDAENIIIENFATVESIVNMLEACLKEE